MITAEKFTNKHDQVPCASCGHPYRNMTALRFRPNNSEDAPVVVVALCTRKCLPTLGFCSSIPDTVSRRTVCGKPSA
jgi:hypothetical protein